MCRLAHFILLSHWSLILLFFFPVWLSVYCFDWVIFVMTLSLNIQPPPVPSKEHLSLGSAKHPYQPLCGSFHFALHKPVAALSTKAPHLPLPHPSWSLHQWGAFPRDENLFFFTVPSSALLFIFFPFSFVLPSYVKVFLPFWKSEICSVQ